MAATIYTRALEANPQDSVALFYRGLAQFNAGRIDQARADIQAAMQIDPANTDYQTWLSENYLALGLSQPSF
ncbi:MAG: tetratricopeptide repeat protein [Chloroflexi bacterium]|nr:tetratricopeptide repeat protein [Chloroflexota bacterium]